MSKFQELETRLESAVKQKQKCQVAIDSIKKGKEKLRKEFIKKVQKKFGMVKSFVMFDERGLEIEVNDIKVFTFNYNTFTFNNIDKELAVELQYLYLEYYGEPVENTGYFLDYSVFDVIAPYTTRG